MADFDVQQVVDAAAKAIYNIGRDPAVSFDDAKSGDLGDATGLYRMSAASSEHDATAAMSVIVPAVTAQVRALHAPMVIEMPAMSDLTWCSHCPGGTNYPCPTVRLLDALDAAVRGEE